MVWNDSEPELPSAHHGAFQLFTEPCGICSWHFACTMPAYIRGVLRTQWKAAGEECDVALGIGAGEYQPREISAVCNGTQLFQAAGGIAPDQCHLHETVNGARRVGELMTEGRAMPGHGLREGFEHCFCNAA